MNKRVLIIDDEDNIRKMTRLTLEAAGYEVGEAESGMEAFAILGGDPSWDVILLDQKMPGMVGTDVLKRLNVMAPRSPVIMMTAFGSIELAVEAMKLGATDFVRKPMTPETIRNAVTAALAIMVKTREPTADGTNLHGSSRFGTITMNGFRILRASDLRIVIPHESNERSFIVRQPDGREQEVVVEIADEALKAVEAVTDRLPLRKSFWTEQAEQFLVDFIWNDGNVPARGRLMLRGVERAEIEKAARKEAEV
jgi:FixJ family two-component response regulator